MFYLDSNLISALKVLPFESVGKIFKSVICEEFTENLNEVEKSLSLEIKSLNKGKKENYKQAALKRWQTRKQEKTQKEDLPKRELRNNNRAYNGGFQQSYNSNIPVKQFDPLLDRFITLNETVI
ncbi:MAG: hypothetical protein IJQ10_00180 [Clostridia bacterium]|nr:hypothetical protein [Clostridia bacterium]